MGTNDSGYAVLSGGPLAIDIDLLDVNDARGLIATRTSPNPTTMNPWHLERRLHHRAMLLLAMQDPGSSKGDGCCDGRTLNKVVRALTGQKRQTIRSWFDRKQWADRIAAHGHDAQHYAVLLYRRMYLSHTAADMEVLGPFISIPIGGPDESATEVQSEVASRLDMLIAEPEPDPEPTDKEKSKATNAWARRRERAVNTNRVLTTLSLRVVQGMQLSVRAALEPEFAKANPNVKPAVFKLTDMPKIRALLKQLQDEEQIISGGQAPGAHTVPDSARVAIAKEMGHPVLSAVAQDLEEAAMMVRQLMSKPLDLKDLQDAQREGAGDTAPEKVSEKAG